MRKLRFLFFFTFFVYYTIVLASDDWLTDLESTFSLFVSNYNKIQKNKDFQAIKNNHMHFQKQNLSKCQV